MSAGMLPDLMIDTMPVIGLGAQDRLDPMYTSALTSHYNMRGCIVVDIDQHMEPLISAMPIMSNNSDMCSYIRMELLRSLVLQVSQVEKPVVFLNLRIGHESTFVKDVLGHSSMFHLLTRENEAMTGNFKIPYLDVTQLHAHVLDSLL